MKYFDLDLKKFAAGDSVKLNSQPKSVAHFGSVTAVVTVEGVVLLRDGSVTLQQKLDFEPGCVALKSETEMAIGEASAGFNLNVYEVVPVNFCAFSSLRSLLQGVIGCNNTNGQAI